MSATVASGVRPSSFRGIRCASGVVVGAAWCRLWRECGRWCASGAGAIVYPHLACDPRRVSAPDREGVRRTAVAWGRRRGSARRSEMSVVAGGVCGVAVVCFEVGTLWVVVGCMVSVRCRGGVARRRSFVFATAICPLGALAVQPMSWQPALWAWGVEAGAVVVVRRRLGCAFPSSVDVGRVPVLSFGAGVGRGCCACRCRSVVRRRSSVALAAANAVLTRAIKTRRDCARGRCGPNRRATSGSASASRSGRLTAVAIAFNAVSLSATSRVWAAGRSRRPLLRSRTDGFPSVDRPRQTG